jgi:hypothetical protein
MAKGIRAFLKVRVECELFSVERGHLVKGDGSSRR